jgi:ABC-2 type transport system permease protein
MELILATYTLWRRDITRFLRQRSRIVGALGTPVVFWVLLGSGLGRSFSVGNIGAPTGGYLEYFYPGTLALILLFTAIFSTISVIEDRHEGFLQGVMVAPIPRVAIALGKILGGTTLALLQSTLFLLLAPLANAEVSLAMLPLLLLVLAVFAFALTGLGFVLAWMLDSTQGFHAIMNLLLFPMWLLSGAVFPPDGAASWIRVAMLINPMTYGVAALRAVLSGTEATGGTTSIGEPLTFIAVFGLVTLALSSWSVTYRRT